MPTAAFTTLGCKVNQYETQRILESFESAGFEVVPFTDVADVYVINTCSVTSQAESKSRQTVRRAKRQNANSCVVVTGCAAQMALNKSEAVEAADLVVPNPSKLETFDYFTQAFPALVEMAAPNVGRIARTLKGRTRATVKIQDGCSVYCSYCSIPYTRPVMTSRPYREVVDEVTQLAKRGYKETILTGVLIGSYGPETGSNGPDFEELVEMLSDIDGIHRVRISSIEMRQVTPRLVDLIKNGKVVPHLHIPLQSGSSKVLSDMNRPYTQDDYIDLCKELYSQIPGIGISTDIMVGFPTETDEEFAQSVKVCEAVRYNKAHLFRFSPRYGTPADAFGDPVDPQTKVERSKTLNAVCSQTRREFFAKHIGHDVEVLVEEKQNRSGLLKGHTPNYLEVEFAGSSSLVGDICTVAINSADEIIATGELSAKKPSRSRLTPLNVLN